MTSRSRFKQTALLGLFSTALLLAPAIGAQTPMPFVSDYAGIPSGSSTIICSASIPTFKGSSSGGANVGDGCLPSQATLNEPSSVLVDQYNNVYIADYNDRLLRVVYQGGAALTAALIAASPAIPNFTPIPGHIYTLAGGITSTMPQTTSNGSSKAYYCNEQGTGTVAVASNGDACPATEAYVEPRGIAVDPNGNVFFANLGGGEGMRVLYVGGTQVANLIKTLNTTVSSVQVGYIYSITGTSTAGFSGDGGAARTAQFENVRGVAVDAGGDLYISDGNSSGSTTNSDVRVINGTTGIITTVAAGPATKSAACPSAGQYNGDGIPASSAYLNSPYSIFFDSNYNLYIADSCNGRLRAIYNSGTLPNVSNPVVGDIYTVAGGGTQVGASAVPATELSIALMQSAGIDHAGNLYIADNTNKYLWKIDPQSGIATLIGGVGKTGSTPTAGSYCNGTAGPQSTDSDGDGCPAIETGMSTSLNLSGDTLGNVYAVESTPGIVQQLSYNNIFPPTAAAATVTQPIAFLNNTTENFTVDGSATTEFSDAGDMACTPGVSGGQGPLCVYNVNFTPAEAGTRSGSLRFSNSSASLFLTGTGVSSEAAIDPGTQTTLGSGLSPTGVAVDSSANVYVADSTGNQVLSFAKGSTTATTLITGLSQPHQVAIDGNGDLFVADTGNNQIVELPAGATSTVALGTSLSAPQGVAVDGLGDLFIADTGNNRVVEIPVNGTQITLPLTGLNAPTRLAIDVSNDLYAVDSGNQRIVELPFDSDQTTVNLGSSSAQPVAVAVDTAGDLYYADGSAQQIVELEAGTTTTDTLVTPLKSPSDLAIDASGSLYLADSGMSGALVVNRSLGNITFPPTNVGESNNLSFTVSNIGNAALTFPGAQLASFTGDSASFTIASATADGCAANSGSSTAPGAQCLLNATFSPSANGPTTATATLLSNAVTPTPAQALLTGNGVNLISTSTSVAITSPTTSTIGYGTPVTVTATVTPSSTTAGAPTGTITINVDGKAQTPVPYGTGTVTVALNPAVGTHVVSASYSGDDNYASSNNSLSFTVTQDTTTTSLTLTTNSSGSVPTLTLTATVNSAVASGETGTVTFFSGTTSIGTATLAGNKATLTTSTTTFSNNSFTAIYSGDSNFVGSTSAAVQPTPDFVVSSSQSTVATAQGGVASIPLTLTPLFNISTTLTPSCSGLPANSVCRFLPTSVTLSGTQPTGLTVEIYTNVSSNIASLERRQPGGIALAVLLPFGAGLLAFGARRRRRVAARLLLCFLTVAASLALGLTTGCVKSQQTPVTPVGTQTVSVSFIASGSTPVTRSVSFSFTVNQRQ
jgi:hypothetical protein